MFYLDHPLHPCWPCTPSPHQGLYFSLFSSVGNLLLMCLFLILGNFCFAISQFLKTRRRKSLIQALNKVKAGKSEREELQQKQILLLFWNDGRRRRREFGSFNFFPCELWLIFYVILSILSTELMLFGFISLMLTVGEQPISKICIPKSVGETFLPCKNAMLRSDIGEEPACEKKVRSIDMKVNSCKGSFTKPVWFKFMVCWAGEDLSSV